MVIVYFPKDFNDCPQWFQNYTKFLTAEYNMDDVEFEEALSIFHEDMKQYKCTIDFMENDIIEKLVFETEAAFTFFLLKWK